MKQIYWANLLHIYQPPDWDKAIIDKVVRESYLPFFQNLKKYPELKITLNICGSLTEQLHQHGHTAVLESIAELAERNQIDFTGSAKYHPILALIPAQEVERQIQLNYDCNRKFFGSAYRPKGFFIPEMCYSEKVAEIVEKLGYKWLVLDEISAQGTVGNTTFQRGYCLGQKSLKIVFRNRLISDLFFMDILKTPKIFFDAIEKSQRTKQYLITGFDGENLGHHNPKLLEIWFKLINTNSIKTLTYSELLSRYRNFDTVKPLPSSWASRESELKDNEPYYLWKNRKNAVHQKQWQLTNLAIKNIKTTPLSESSHQRARNMLDKAMSSDQYWWAAASPWWDTNIVAQAANKLLRVFRVLGVNKTTLRQATKIHDEIIDLIEQWQTSGEADRIRKDYLGTEDFTRVFGGQKVT